jgi:photosystem II stability/assembly factor-like uncharacterized protein
MINVIEYMRFIIVLIVVFFGLGHVSYSISQNNDGSWSIYSSGTTNWLSDQYFISNQKGWVVGANGHILHTNDGGQSWEKQDSGFYIPLKKVFFFNAYIGWAVGNGGTIIKTIDGGRNWNLVERITHYDFESVFFLDELNGFVVGRGGILLRTVDGGENWTFQETGVTRWLYNIYFLDNKNGWIVGAFGTILKTNNGGLSWTSQSFKTFDHIYAVHFSDKDNGWVVGSNNLILKTVNGGANWVQTGIWFSNYSDVYFYNKDIGWVIGSSGNIFYTKDSGQNWVRQISGVTHSLSSIQILDKKTGWIVGERGTILKYREIPDKVHLMKPLNGIDNVPLELIFEWNLSEGSDYYELELSQDSLLNVVDHNFLNISEPIFELNNIVNSGTNYYWRVRGHNELGPGVWSEVFSFKTIYKKPEVVQLIEPRNGEVISNLRPKLKWEISADAINYHVNLSKSNVFDELILDSDDIIGDQMLVENELENNNTYYWRVKAINDSYSSDWSEIYSFEIELVTSLSKYDTPDNSLLLQNYPNPFNPKTDIIFQLDKSSEVVIEIFNSIGVKITSIGKGVYSKGVHSIEFDAKNLPSGMYLYSIITPEYRATNKMMLLK